MANGQGRSSVGGQKSHQNRCLPRPSLPAFPKCLAALSQASRVATKTPAEKPLPSMASRKASGVCQFPAGSLPAIAEDAAHWHAAGSILRKEALASGNHWQCDPSFQDVPEQKTGIFRPLMHLVAESSSEGALSDASTEETLSELSTDLVSEVASVMSTLSKLQSEAQETHSVADSEGRQTLCYSPSATSCSSRQDLDAELDLDDLESVMAVTEPLTLHDHMASQAEVDSLVSLCYSATTRPQSPSQSSIAETIPYDACCNVPCLQKESHRIIRGVEVFDIAGDDDTDAEEDFFPASVPIRDQTDVIDNCDSDSGMDDESVAETICPKEDGLPILCLEIPEDGMSKDEAPVEDAGSSGCTDAAAAESQDDTQKAAATQKVLVHQPDVASYRSGGEASGIRSLPYPSCSDVLNRRKHAAAGGEAARSLPARLAPVPLTCVSTDIQGKICAAEAAHFWSTAQTSFAPPIRASVA